MTTQQTKVDWSRPIEAVHEDGRVVAVTAVRADDGDMITDQDLDGCRRSFRRDTGKSWLSHVHWRIRNVAQPEVPTPSPELTARMAEVRDLDAARKQDAAMWDRMVALVKRMALADKAEVDWMGTGQQEAYTEARAIAAELEPVDQEIERVAELMCEADGYRWDQTPEGVAKYNSDGMFRDDYRKYARFARRALAVAGK